MSGRDESAADRFAESLKRNSEAGESPIHDERESRTLPAARLSLGGAHATGVARLGPGERLPDSARKFFEPRLQRDLHEVRIHRGPAAAESASAMNARAYTIGTHIVFGRGELPDGATVGNRVLAHELAHVSQQSDAGTAAVQCKLRPQDVSSEMVGRQFELVADWKAGPRQLREGQRVKIETWSNTSDTVRASLVVTDVAEAPLEFDVSKTLLRPAGEAVTGIARYGAGVAEQHRDISAGERAIAREKARAGGPRPGEIPRLEGLQRNRFQALNERLIQETMFNRFDPIIRKWTEHYNVEFGYKGKEALDPGLVKPMLYEESRLGTSGKHLEWAPKVHFRTRFNVGQVIDSAASALLVMMREMQPELIKKYHLESIEADRDAAQKDLKALKSKKKRTKAEDVRMGELSALEIRSEELKLSFGETFMWFYQAPGHKTGFDEAVMDFFYGGGKAKARHLDYEFWIRTAIRWLFEKRRSVKSWHEAVRAYNGSGARAERYRDDVTGRQARAESASSGSFDVLRDEREQEELRKKKRP